MLADELIGAAGSPNDALLKGALTEFAKRLRKAQAFEFAPEVMRSAFTISHSPVGAQLRALPLCRLPFRLTWFEWLAGFTGKPSERSEAPVPKRMGALVETDDSFQRGTIFFAWFHPDQGVNVCPLAITFDWRAEAEPVPDMNPTRGQSVDEQWNDLKTNYPRIRNSTREDVFADNMRFGIVVNPMQSAVLRAIPLAGFRALMAASIKDLEGEAPILRAAIMLLNSRNLARHEAHPAPVKLNAARAKRGKAPLVDYTHVQIRLSRALAERAAGAGDPRSPSRLHLVRGHFKIRSSGVYWWSPHPRGVPDAAHPIRRQDRAVTV